MGSNGDIVIEARGLSKRFGDFVVVRDLDLTVRRGQIYGFLGPNGSGKTTTMRMLVGLLEPDSGTGTCLGHDIRTGRSALREQVGYMTQHFSLYTDLSVIENLEFIANVYGVSDPAATVRNTIEKLGLEGREHQLVGTLSGGWKQRLSLGAATMPGPRLLLLDEPTAGVDPKARREFWDMIYAMANEGLTVLVSTHYMDEAERCHEIAYLAYSRLLASGTVSEVIEQAGLHMWEVEGSAGHLSSLAAKLNRKDGITMATPFGTRLRVGGPDKEKVREAINEYRDDERYSWTESRASLEDTFIHLLRKVPDDRRTT